MSNANTVEDVACNYDICDKCFRNRNDPRKAFVGLKPLSAFDFAPVKKITAKKAKNKKKAKDVPVSGMKWTEIPAGYYGDELT
jgi:hypothetical protein